MKIKKSNEAAGNVIGQRKIKVATLFTLAIFILGEIALLGAYSTKPTHLSKISSFVIQDSRGSAENSLNWLLVLASVSLAILSAINLLFLWYLRKAYGTLAQDNKEVLLEINKQKNDEIKEMALTRNVILMKLMRKSKNT